MAKKSPYESGELTDSIFLILLACLKPIHGYKLMQIIQEMTNGIMEIGPATMYTTLKKLSAAGWIVTISEEENKILYQVTKEGNKVLQEDLNRRKKLMEIAEHYFISEGKVEGKALSTIDFKSVKGEMESENE